MPVGVLGPMLGAVKSGGGIGNVGAQFRSTVGNMMSNVGGQLSKFPSYSPAGMLGRAMSSTGPSMSPGGVKMSSPGGAPKAGGVRMPKPQNKPPHPLF